MTDSNDNSNDYRVVSELLTGLRRRIRQFVLIEAVLMALVVLGAVFWGGLLVDWMFEPSPQVRIVVHVLVVIVLLFVLVWWGLRRWMVALSDQSLALVVERKHAELADSLSAAVDLRAQAAAGAALHPELARRTLKVAAEAASRIDPDSLTNQLRLNRFALSAAGLGLSVVLLAIAVPSVWATYADRIALSPAAWPRKVNLTVQGFEPDGAGGWVRKVARNSNVPVVVLAELEGGKQAPDRVTIRYRWQEGRRGRDDLVRIGDAVPGHDSSQRYEYLFERISGDVEFAIRGGDDRIERLRLIVVERPKVTELKFVCRYPGYLERSSREISVGPRVELPEGTQVAVNGRANKPLKSIRWRQVVQTDDAPLRTDTTTTDFNSTFNLDVNDLEVELELLDIDGIVSAEPFRVAVAARRDQKPQVTATRSGIGSAVTANARLPMEVEIEDDHAIGSAWCEMNLDNESLQTIDVELPTSFGREVLAVASIDLRELAAAHPDDPQYRFAAGQRITITAAADDRYDLDDNSRTASARALSFEIVTEDELMSRLASAEQNLRQTFESVADKLLLLYDSLEKLETNAQSAATDVEADFLVVDTQDKNANDVDADLLDRESGRLSETALQIGDEVLGIATGFEDIHAQLDNNRIVNSELSDRIGNRIATPLRELGGMRMTSVADRISDIAKDGRATSAAKIETRQAIVEVEHLLREMQGLESYNEVIAMLRDIIRQQKQINAKTTEQQKSELRDLLLD